MLLSIATVRARTVPRGKVITKANWPHSLG